jgi:hypothetical protein
LAHYGHLENIPKGWRGWHSSIGNARRLAASLFNSWDDALLFRTLATLRVDAPVFDALEELRWKGPKSSFEERCRTMKSPDLYSRATIARRKYWRKACERYRRQSGPGITIQSSVHRPDAFASHGQSRGRTNVAIRAV